MPKYDFRCSSCGTLFELRRSFSQSDDPAICPHDGTVATRLFSPPLDLLMYRREPVVDTRPVTIPPGALSCHDHGPPPPEGDEYDSHWHAHGYVSAEEYEADQGRQNAHAQSHGHGHSH